MLFRSNTGRLDLATGAGQTLTREEREAAANKRALTADSPRPQSVYYRPGAKPDDPMLANVKLRYGAAKR